MKVLFTQDSVVEDLFCGASPSSEPSLFFSNYLISLGFEPVGSGQLYLLHVGRWSSSAWEGNPSKSF